MSVSVSTRIPFSIQYFTGVSELTITLPEFSKVREEAFLSSMALPRESAGYRSSLSAAVMVMIFGPAGSSDSSGNGFPSASVFTSAFVLPSVPVLSVFVSVFPVLVSLVAAGVGVGAVYFWFLSIPFQ